MKKTVSVIVSSIIVLCALMMTGMGHAENATGSIDMGAWFCYGADGKYVWCMTGRDVTVFNAETLEEVSAFSVGFDTKQIYPCEETAYFVIRENVSTKIICTDMQGGISGEWTLDEPLNVYQVERVGDRLYLVVNPNADESYDDQYEFAYYGFHRLYSMDLNAGGVVQVDGMPDVGWVTAAGDKLLCIDTVIGTVYVYDTVSGTIEEEITIPGILMMDVADTGEGYYISETWLEDGTPVAGVGRLDVDSGEYGMWHELPTAFSMRIAVAGSMVFTAFCGDTALTYTNMEDIQGADDTDADNTAGDTIEYDAGGTFKYAVQDDHVWIFTDGHVRVLDADLDEIISEFDVSFECMHAAARENSVYVETDARQIVELDIQGNSSVVWDVPNEINIGQFEVTGDSLVMISAEEEIEDAGHLHASVYGQIYEYSFTDGALREVSADGADRAETIAVNNELTGVYADGGLTFLRPEGTAILNVMGISYFTLTDSGRCFAIVTAGIEESMLIEIDMETGKTAQICNLGASKAGIRSGGRYLYIMDAEKDTLIGIAEPEVREKTTVLTIIGDDYDPYSPQMEYTVRQMAMRHPEVSVEFETYGVVGDTAPLITSLMSGESRYDILMLSEYGLTNTRRYYRAGALMNLSSSDEIMESLGNMIDVQDIFTENGGIFAVPVRLVPVVWQVNEELFNHYGLTIPGNGWTWDGFYKLGEDVARLRNEGEDIILLADTDSPFFLLQYNVNEIVNSAPDYLSDIFLDNMSLWVDAVDAGLIDSELALETNALWSEAPVENALFTVKELMYSSLKDGRYILPPVYADYVRTPVHTWCMSINSNTDNADLAVEFVALYISEDILKTDEVVWEGRLLKEVEDCERFEHYPDEYYPSAENELFWETAILNGVQYSMIGEYMYTQIYEWYPALLGGGMSLNEFAYISQEKADMAAGE